MASTAVWLFSVSVPIGIFGVVKKNEINRPKTNIIIKNNTVVSQPTSIKEYLVSKGDKKLLITSDSDSIEQKNTSKNPKTILKAKLKRMD